MAIKGKSRRRARAKGVHSPPKPVITQKKLPTLARADLRRAIAVALGLAVVLGGLRVWQNTGRSDALRSYVAKLAKATEPYTAHLATDGATGLDAKIRDFTGAKGNAADFRALTEQWEKDFRKAKENVVALTPPDQIRQAEDWLVAGLDGLIGAVRLFNVAAQQRVFADLPAQDKLQQKLEDQVQVVILHANEALTRGRDAYLKASDLIASYLKSWHVTEQPPPSP